MGAAGYTGGEMCRLLLNHPCCELAFAQSSSNAGNYLWEVHTDLFGETDLKFCKEILPQVDVLFLCMGHGKSVAFFEQNTLPATVKVIDLGNDFRLEKAHRAAGREFVYGLVEASREQIRNSDSVANPGCFATAIQLALLPLAQAGLLTDDVHVTATTGSTGAGQALSATTHFSWRANNLSTYKNFSHQHLSEIGETIHRLQPGFRGAINFVPYRGDFPRGIIATLYTKCALSQQQAQQLYENYYADARFTHVSPVAVSMKQVVNTAKCLLSVEKHGDNLLITSVIDNLLKGAAGQAVENMNLMFGFAPDAGLKLKPLAF